VVALEAAVAACEIRSSASTIAAAVGPGRSHSAHRIPFTVTLLGSALSLAATSCWNKIRMAFGAAVLATARRQLDNVDELLAGVAGTGNAQGRDIVFRKQGIDRFNVFPQ